MPPRPTGPPRRGPCVHRASSSCLAPSRPPGRPAQLMPRAARSGSSSSTPTHPSSSRPGSSSSPKACCGCGIASRIADARRSAWPARRSCCPCPRGPASCSTSAGSGPTSVARSAAPWSTACTPARAGTGAADTTQHSCSPPVRPVSVSAPASCGRCTSPGRAPPSAGRSARRSVRPRSAGASCSRRARWRWPRGSPSKRRGPSRSTRPTGSTASPTACIPGCGHGRRSPADLGRSFSTRGRRSTSTSRSRSSSPSSTPPPAWASSASCSTTAGSSAVATTAVPSATGPSIRRSGPAARAHPDWVLGRPGGPEWRFQRVLDLTAPGAADHLFERLDALLAGHDIAYLKWDHNRDLLAGSAHAQTHAVYALIDRLRTAHPGVEIESCASGGARVDLGILERTDRVWPSDTNDPLERQSIQRFTSLVLPPEYVGSHLGAARAHTTGRTAELSFRFATALFGSAGIEWNLATASDAELDAVAAWTSEYRRLRPLLHGGRVVRADAADPAQLVHGVVASGRRHAVFSVAMLASATTALPPAVRMPGLDPDATYTLRVLDLGPVRTIQDSNPPWLDAGEVRL